MKTKTVNLFFTLMIFLIMLAYSCKKELSYLGPLKIITDKQIYKINDPIIIEVNNSTDSTAVHSWSDLHNFVPTIYKYENESWSGYSVDYIIENNHCCKELLPGTKEIDTLNIDFVKGVYRIEYYFTMKPGNKYRYFYSNIFIVE